MPYLNRGNYQLHYREEGKGKLLIILPGNTASSASFLNEIEHLSKLYHTIALDFRGTGLSDRLENWTFSRVYDNVDDVAALIEHLGEKEAILAGVSGGAIIALLTALKYPDKVKAVVADSCVEKVDVDKIKSVIASLDFDAPELIRFWKKAHGEDWRTIVEQDNKLLLMAANSKLDVFDGRLKEISCPVLLCGSLKDSIIKDIPEQMTNMAKQIPHATLFLSDEGDHPLMWTAPKVFRLRIKLFLSALK